MLLRPYVSFRRLDSHNIKENDFIWGGGHTGELIYLKKLSDHTLKLYVVRLEIRI